MEKFTTLGIALGVGLLIGLQRERTEDRLGGIRTFPLISVFGFLCGLLAGTHGGWVMAAGFLTVFGILAVSNLRSGQRENSEAGLTTEVAAMVTFAIGAYLVTGDYAPAVVTAGVMTVLLHLKAPMHAFVDNMGRRDMRALIQFVVITLVVLPLLPGRPVDPFHLLNPFNIWLMVVLIVGISLAGYIAHKLLGPKAGMLWGAIFGGVVSSTATTLSYSRRSKAGPKGYILALIAILIASAVAYGRLIVIVAIVAPGGLAHMILPIGVMLVWMSLICATVYWRCRSENAPMTEPSNPAQLKGALLFGVFFAVVLFATGLAKQKFGQAGLLGASLISGLADLDAITLSLSQMIQQKAITPNNGWHLIVSASLANLVFKGILAAFLGSRALAVRLALCFGIALIGGLALLWLWPESWQVANFNPT